MRSVSDINDQFELIAIQHAQIRRFYTNSVEEMDIDKLTVVDFPMLYAQVTGATVETGVTTFDFEVVVADLVVERQLPTLDEVYTSTFLIMQDVIGVFQNTEAETTGVDDVYGLEMPIVCQPFTAAYNNLLTGWSTSFSIRVPNALDPCLLPS